MDTELARTFLTVAASGNFVAAASRLHITQSTVSARIQTLESTLGTRLFERGRHGPTLTTATVREIGRSVDDFSKLWFTVSGAADVLDQVVADLVSHGCVVEGNEPVTLRPSSADRTVPDDFYSTTNHHTEVHHAGTWIPVGDQRMDACVVIDPAGWARCVKLRDISQGDLVVCGATGVRVHPPFKSRQATDFVFMGNEVSSERRVERMVEVILDGRLQAAIDDHDVFDTGVDRFLDHELDGRHIDDGSISLGTALVAGRKRVPRPAAGITALRIEPRDMAAL